nr:MAG TPA: hypothetical protein [Caudoviricetes sp.]
MAIREADSNRRRTDTDRAGYGTSGRLFLERGFSDPSGEESWNS